MKSARAVEYWSIALCFTMLIVLPAQGVETAASDGVRLEAVDASRIVPYENAFVVTIYKDGKSQSPGIWTDQVKITTLDNRRVAVRTQSMGYADGRTLVSVNTFDPSDFEPIADIQVRPDGSRERWSFDKRNATGILTDPSGKEVQRVFPLDRRYFDLNCCMRSLLPAMIRLSKDLAFEVPSIEGADGPTAVKFKVLGREVVHAGTLGNVTAWLVETNLPGGYIHFWIYDRPPYLVRMTLSAHDKKDYSQSFDMIEPGPTRRPPDAPSQK